MFIVPMVAFNTDNIYYHVYILVGCLLYHHLCNVSNVSTDWCESIFKTIRCFVQSLGAMWLRR